MSFTARAGRWSSAGLVVPWPGLSYTSCFMGKWDSLTAVYGSAAELRFNGSYVIRYGGEDPAPVTDFIHRFIGREELVSMYAMAARQADQLSEYLCLYRILEAADQRNGKIFAAD